MKLELRPDKNRYAVAIGKTGLQAGWKIMIDGVYRGRIDQWFFAGEKYGQPDQWGYIGSTGTTVYQPGEFWTAIADHLYAVCDSDEMLPEWVYRLRQWDAEPAVTTW